MGWVTVYNSVSYDPAEEAQITYRKASEAVTPAVQEDVQALEALTFRLLPTQTDDVVANSVRFSLGGRTYDDQGGSLISGNDNLPSGSVNLDTGDCTITYWEDGVAANPNVTSLLTRYGQWVANEAFFRTATAPIAPEGLSVVAVTLEGEQRNGAADQDGNITGTGVLGAVNYQFGIAGIQFGEMVLDSSLSAEEKDEPWYDPADVDGSGYIWKPQRVDPGTIKYNAVAYSYIPLPANILGVNAVRLPPDGRVPIYKPGDVAMVMHRMETAPVTPTVDVPVALGRTRVAWVRVIDANGDTVTDGYTLDREAGEVTFNPVPTHTPVTIRHTVGDLRLITDVQITGDITLARPVSHDFPAGETLIASCLLFGDRRARVSHLWDQVSWNGTWQDSIEGGEATATLNTIDFPITVTNEGCDTDRWVFRVVNAGANQWELISEKRGLVWSGTYAPGGDDVAPINPRTRVWDEMGQAWVGGTPYMTIPGMANGGGWSNGNIVRINTVGAIADFWIARSIAQSDEPAGDGRDGAEIYALGNIDRPE